MKIASSSHWQQHHSHCADDNLAGLQVGAARHACCVWRRAVRTRRRGHRTHKGGLSLFGVGFGLKCSLKGPRLFELYPNRLFTFGLSPFGRPMTFGLSPFELFQTTRISGLSTTMTFGRSPFGLFWTTGTFGLQGHLDEDTRIFGLSPFGLLWQTFFWEMHLYHLMHRTLGKIMLDNLDWLDICEV